MNARTQHTMGSWTREAGMKEPTGSDVSNPLAVKAVRNARGGQPGAGSQGRAARAVERGRVRGRRTGRRVRRRGERRQGAAQPIHSTRRETEQAERRTGEGGQGRRGQGGRTGGPRQALFLGLVLPSQRANAHTHTQHARVRAEGGEGASRAGAGDTEHTVPAARRHVKCYAVAGNILKRLHTEIIHVL